MDADPPPPSAARACIDEVRQARIAGGRKLTGSVALPERQRLVIHAMATSGAVPVPDEAITPRVEERLLEWFEEMARRTRHPVPAVLRRDVLALLVTELYANARSLDVSPERLVTVTVLHGAIGPELRKEFPEFEETPGVFRHVITQSPTDPRADLRRVRTVTALLEQDDEFAQFRETPWVFKAIVRANPSDPRKALRKVQRTVAALAADEEFARFRTTPNVFLRLAVSNLGDARAALRRLMHGREAEDAAGTPHAEQVEARRTLPGRGARDK